MTIEEAKKLTFLISRIDDGNNCLMNCACSDANAFFPPWHFEVIKSKKYDWTYQVRLSQMVDGVSLWEITSEEIKREIDDKEQNNSVPEQKI